MSRKTQRRHKTYKHPQYVERKPTTEDKLMEMLKKAFPTAFMKDVELRDVELKDFQQSQIEEEQKS